MTSQTDNSMTICQYWDSLRGCRRRNCKFLHVEYPPNQMQIQTKPKPHKKRPNTEIKNKNNVHQPPQKKQKLNKNVLRDVTNINATVKEQKEQKQADKNAEEMMVSEFMEHAEVIQALLAMIIFDGKTTDAILPNIYEEFTVVESAEYGKQFVHKTNEGLILNLIEAVTYILTSKWNKKYSQKIYKY
eukprot:167552_1